MTSKKLSKLFIFVTFENENLPESGRIFKYFGYKISAMSITDLFLIEDYILLFSIHCNSQSWRDLI